MFSFVARTKFPDWSHLQRSAHERERQAFAPGTYTNLELQWSSYLNFCAFYQLEYYPATEENLVLYIKFLEFNLKSPNSIKNYVVGAKTMLHWLGHSVQAFNSLRVRHMLRAVARMSKHIVKQAAPITPQILYDIKRQLSFDCGDDFTFWAACILAFMLMLRKSNLVPNTKQTFDSDMQFKTSNVQVVRNAVWVTITWSKTLKFRCKELRYPLLKIPGSELCPYRAVCDMLHNIPRGSDDPLLIRQDGSVWTYSQFQNKLRACLRKGGYKSENFSSHSFRHGGCSFAWQSGMPEFMIQILGDWRSEVYKRYCQVDMQSRANACMLFRRQLLKLNL